MQNARPDSARRTDAKDGGKYPGDLASVLRSVEGKFSAEAIDAALADVARAVDANSFEKLSRVPGVNPSRLISGGAGAVARFRQTNAALIRSLPADLAADVGSALAEVDVRDLHVKDVGEILSERFGVAESKGEFWARDQTLKLYANVQETRQRAAGASQYQWEDSDDERVRGRPGGLWERNASNHWILRNTIQQWSTPPVTNPKTGERNHPGHDRQCRCSAYPLFDGDPIEVAPPEEDPTTPEEEAADLRALAQEPVEPIGSFTRRGRGQPTPRTAPPEVTPTQTNALGLADALESGSPSDQRAALRDIVQQALPEAVSKDVRAGAHALKTNDYLLSAADAEAIHEWDGTIQVDTSVFNRAKSAIRKIATAKPTDVLPVEDTDSLRVLIHEELHGHSRASFASYRGAGMVLEEVGTELHAREVVRTIYAPAEFSGAYQDWIDTVVNIVQGAADDRDRATTVKRVLAAHGKILGAGAKFANPEQAVSAFVAGLDLNPEALQYVKQALLKTFEAY